MTDLLNRLQGALSGRYRVERELGSGGTGVVFLAQDQKHDRNVAIKVLRPEIGQSLGAERFLEEIRIAAGLSHPHILSLIDSGEADGLLYYVMFYVDGESLADRLRREKQLPIPDAVRIAREAAEALGHAHAAGVIHRDVKPENILLSAGHALVCDFGIACAIGRAGGDELTKTGFVVGTPAYMSPEQAMGDALDGRSDVYSLGTVLFEMLLGTVPFAGTTPQAMLARKSVETAPGLRVVRDTVPDHVEHAVARALARVPADRFGSAEEFAVALDDPSFRQGTGTGARGRPRGAWAAAAGAGVVALGGAAVFMAVGGNDAPTPLRTSFTQLTAQLGAEDAPSLSPDGMWVVYAGEDGADRDIFLHGIGGQLPINLTEDSSDDDYAPAISPDGERIAFRSSREGGGLFTMGRTGEAVRRVTDAGHNPTWSPDGTRLAFASEYVGFFPLNLESGSGGLFVTDLETGETVQLTDDDAILPAWSPNGAWIAYARRSASSDLYVVRPGGGEAFPLTTDASNDWGPTWSPDGSYLYFSSDRGGSMNLWRIAVDPDAGRPIGEPESVTTPSAFLAHPSVSTDGTRIVYSSVLMTQNIEKAAFDPVAGTVGESVPLTTGSRQWSSPDPSPDGEWVAFYSRDRPEGDLYVVRSDGTGLREVIGDSAIDRMPRWSPDGSRLSYFSNRSGELQTWLIAADGSDNRRLTFGAGTFEGVWSPDGERMAVNAVPTGVYVLEIGVSWEEQTPQPIVSETDWGRFLANDWSTDGGRIAGMYDDRDSGVGVHTVATGEHSRLTDFGEWPVWLPDDRRILFVSGGEAFYLLDSEGGDVRQIFSGGGDALGPPRLTADGSLVVYSRRVTEADLWMVTIE